MKFRQPGFRSLRRFAPPEDVEPAVFGNRGGDPSRQGADRDGPALREPDPGGGDELA